MNSFADFNELMNNERYLKDNLTKPKKTLYEGKTKVDMIFDLLQKKTGVLFVGKIDTPNSFITAVFDKDIPIGIVQELERIDKIISIGPIKSIKKALISARANIAARNGIFFLRFNGS